MESRAKKSFRNIATGFGNKILTFLFAFATRTIFIRLLGAEYTGIDGLYTNILSVLSFADLGISTVLTYSLYQALKDEDTSLIASIIHYYKKIYFCIGFAVLGIGLALIPFLRFIINSNLPQNDLVIYYVLFLANTSASYFFVYKTTILEADQKQYIANIASTFFILLMYVFQIGYLLIRKDYVGYLVIHVLCTVGRNVYLGIFSNKKYPFLSNREIIDESKINKKELFKNVKATFISRICAVLLNNTDNILISMIVGTVAVGYYSNYALLIQYVSAYIYAFTTGLIASIGNHNAESDMEKSYGLYNSVLLLFSGIACVCVAIFFCCIQEFVVVWIGKEYVLDINCVVAALLVFYTSTVNTPNAIYRETMGVFVEVQYMMIPTVIINIVLSYATGRFFGISGIIYSTAVSKLLTNYWYEPNVLFRKKFKKSVRRYYIKQIYNLFITVIAVAVSYYICSFLGSSLPFIFLRAFISFVVSFGLWFAMNKKTEGMDYLIARAKGFWVSLKIRFWGNEK